MWAKPLFGAASFIALVACGSANDINQPAASQAAGDSDAIGVSNTSASSLHRLGDIGVVNRGQGDDGPSAGDSAPQTKTSGALTRICPMGDSITAGDTQHETYRRPLWKSLQSLQANVDFVGSMHDNNTVPPPYTDYDLDNEGHGGYRSDELANDLPQWVVEYDPPDIVLLHIGTNDLGQGRSTNEVLGSIAQIIAIVRSRNDHVTIALAQIIGQLDDDFNAEASELNAAMPAFADANSTSTSVILPVDQMSTFDPATMTTDGTHPNDAGSEEIANIWLAALRPLLGV